MLFSKTCDYGIRATLYVACHTDRAFVPIKEISEQLHISFHFLTKILQILTRNNILNSYRGPNGGVSFAVSTDRIFLYDIVKVIDGTALFDECLLGLKNCNKTNPCPIHNQWGQLREDIRSILQQKTLSELATKIKQGEWRISDLIV